MNQHVDKITRGCAPKEMYDDNSYCEHKIKKCENIYYREVGGGCDTHCSDCMLHIVLAAVEDGETFTYEDQWRQEFEYLADLQGMQRLERLRKELTQ